MLGLSVFYSLLGKLSFVTLIVLTTVLVFLFAGPIITHDLFQHAATIHANPMVCGGLSGPPCGNSLP